eukprot:8403766-Pyramimonas_sp.AAC.1
MPCNTTLSHAMQWTSMRGLNMQVMQRHPAACCAPLRTQRWHDTSLCEMQHTGDGISYCDMS